MVVRFNQYTPELLYQVDATGVAVNPWDPGRKVSLILKEIEMSPSFFSSVMNFPPFCPAFGTITLDQLTANLHAMQKVTYELQALMEGRL